MCVFALGAGTRTASALDIQVPDYVDRVWTLEHGLPQNIVSVLHASRDGYLWIGASSGVIRFDGLTFTAFDLSNTPALRSNRITSFHETPDGTLWIGTTKGLVRHRLGQFSREEGDAGFDEDTIHTIDADAEGRLLAAGEKSVYRRAGNGRWQRLPIEGLESGIRGLAVDRRGSAWIALDHRLIEWRDRPLRTFGTSDGLPAATIRALHADRGGRIWIGTGRGLAQLDPATGRITAETGPLAQLRVNRLLVDRDDVLWIGGAGTLATRRPDGQVAVHPVSHPRDDAPVVALEQDTAGQIWFGIGSGPGGLHRLTRRRVRTVTRDEGLPCDNVGPVAQAADGVIWLAALCSEGSGLVSMKDGRLRSYVGAPGAPAIVFALLPMPDGSLLIGESQAGLTRFADGRFAPVPGPFRPGVTRINVLHRDADGAVWVGLSDGVARYRDGKWQTWRAPDGLARGAVRSIVSGRDRSIWIGAEAGVSRYENGRFVTFDRAHGIPAGEVRAIHPDAEGAVWIGTYGGGLARLKDGRATAFGARSGLLDLTVHRIMEDERGDLWLGGDRGIRRVSRRQLAELAEGKDVRPSVELFDTADGMKNAECNGMGQPAGLRSTDGRLWFPTQGGLVGIDPAARAQALTPRTAIERVLVNGVEQPSTQAEAITLPSGGDDIEIRYTAPALVRPEQVYFRYRLVGHHDAWIHVGRRRIAHFAGLAPGDYRFEVAARSGAGSWDTPTTTLAVAVQPRLHQRLAFKLAAGGGLLLALMVGVRWRLRQFRQREQALEAVVAARTGELRAKQDGLEAALRELSAAKAELEETHARLITTFNQLRVGVVLVDAESCVRFISDATRRLVGDHVAEPIGQPIERVLPIRPDAAKALRAQIRSPRPGVRVTMELVPAPGQQYWAELEVQSDPGDATQRVVYVYDVTETIDLKRALNEAAGRPVGSELLGESIPMRALRSEIATVAGLDATVLIEGETGTGKELVARAIHEASRRKHRPFVAINCAGLTESILASQLFGHRRGAFTGAVSDQVGLFEAANGGTLLLDEIGDMPMGVQTHLLRVLQEREILRVGDARPRPIDVRVLAATHRDLEADVQAGRFREDLLYRIRVVRMRVPPLRLRGGDIALLAAAFLRQACASHGLQVQSISRDAVEHLQTQRWPGNVRELKATIEGAAIRATGPVLKLTDLLSELPSEPVPGPRRTIPERERRLLLDALRQTGGNRKAAARLLGMARSTLYRRLAILEADGAVLPPDTSVSNGNH